MTEDCEGWNGYGPEQEANTAEIDPLVLIVHLNAMTAMAGLGAAMDAAVELMESALNRG